MYQEIIDEIESSLALLEPPAFKVKPTNLSFKNNWFSGKKSWFSGIWAEYQNVKVFIPHNELKPPYFLRTAAENLVKSRSFIEVYPLRIDINKKSYNPRKWQLPIFTMFPPTDKAVAVRDALEIKSCQNFDEINIKEGEKIAIEDFELQVIGVEYHQNNEKRAKSVIFRITAPSKYPILRPEQEAIDFKKWENLPEHSDRKLSKTIRRFFYQKRGINIVEVGETKITLLPFFNKQESKKLRQEGYVGTLKIKRGK